MGSGQIGGTRESRHKRNTSLSKNAARRIKVSHACGTCTYDVFEDNSHNLDKSRRGSLFSSSHIHVPFPPQGIFGGECVGDQRANWENPCSPGWRWRLVSPPLWQHVCIHCSNIESHHATILIISLSAPNWPKYTLHLAVALPASRRTPKVSYCVFSSIIISSCQRKIIILIKHGNAHAQCAQCARMPFMLRRESQDLDGLCPSLSHALYFWVDGMWKTAWVKLYILHEFMLSYDSTKCICSLAVLQERKDTCPMCESKMVFVERPSVDWV